MLVLPVCDDVKVYWSCYWSFFDSLILVAELVLQLQLTPLHHASDSGHLPVVLALLDAGANVRVQDGVSVGSLKLHLYMC